MSTNKKTKSKTSAKKPTKRTQASKTTKKTTKKRSAKKTTPKKTAAKQDTLDVVKNNEKAIVEKVYNERNLTTGVEDLSEEQHNEIKKMILKGSKQPSIAKNKKQQEILDFYSNMIESTMNEVENLASYVPKEEVLDLVYENPALVAALRDADAWTVHQLNGVYYLKTGINTIEPVKDYIFRLERVCLEYQKLTDEAQLRVDEIQTSAMKQVDGLRQDLYTYTDGGFWELIKLAFSRLFKGV